MDWITRMNKAVDYMESNLLKKINFNKISKEADSTPYHFQRMFHMITGITVGEYIRRRRLTRAAQEIATSSENIINIALKYGYESHASFTRAFTKLHGFSPVMARKTGIKIKAYPPLSFHLSVKGEASIDYKIRELKQFRFAGRMLKVATDPEINREIIPEFINKCYEDGSMDIILENAVTPGIFNGAVAGAFIEYQDNYENFIFMVGTESYIDPVPEGMEARIIKPQTYAIFEDTGPLPVTLHKLRERIYSEWFPATQYIHVEGPNFEMGYSVTPGMNMFRSELWIPVMQEK
ncbi:MAG: AraC family transcriptional regulator [Spirochaetes bacterium]|nr:AraC family transcriptional regulator [Spirochaetota bacterium]